MNKTRMLMAVATASTLSPNRLWHLDAGSLQSYAGGQTWANLETAPADGSAASAYNFNVGLLPTTEPVDPVFHGTPGGMSANEYWSFSSSAYSVMKVANGNTAVIDSFHKSGASFTLLYFISFGALSSYQQLAITFSGNRGVGLQFCTNGSSLIMEIGQGANGPQRLVSPNEALTANKPLCVALSVKENGGNGGSRFYVNGTEFPFNAAYASPSSAAASEPFRISRESADSLSTGSKLWIAQGYNRALSKAELDEVFNTYRGRFGI